jgi:hypothetical protein
MKITKSTTDIYDISDVLVAQEALIQSNEFVSWPETPLPQALGVDLPSESFTPLNLTPASNFFVPDEKLKDITRPLSKSEFPGSGLPLDSPSFPKMPFSQNDEPELDRDPTWTRFQEAQQNLDRAYSRESDQDSLFPKSGKDAAGNTAGQEFLLIEDLLNVPQGTLSSDGNTVAPDLPDIVSPVFEIPEFGVPLNTPPYTEKSKNPFSLSSTKLYGNWLDSTSGSILEQVSLGILKGTLDYAETSIKSVGTLVENALVKPLVDGNPWSENPAGFWSGRLKDVFLLPLSIAKGAIHFFSNPSESLQPLGDAVKEKYNENRGAIGDVGAQVAFGTEVGLVTLDTLGTLATRAPVPRSKAIMPALKAASPEITSMPRNITPEAAEGKGVGRLYRDAPDNPNVTKTIPGSAQVVIDPSGAELPQFESPDLPNKVVSNASSTQPTLPSRRDDVKVVQGQIDWLKTTEAGQSLFGTWSATALHEESRYVVETTTGSLLMMNDPMKDDFPLDRHGNLDSPPEYLENYSFMSLENLEAAIRATNPEDLGPLTQATLRILEEKGYLFRGESRTYGEIVAAGGLSTDGKPPDAGKLVYPDNLHDLDFVFATTDYDVADNFGDQIVIFRPPGDQLTMEFGDIHRSKYYLGPNYFSSEALAPVSLAVDIDYLLRRSLANPSVAISNHWMLYDNVMPEVRYEKFNFSRLTELQMYRLAHSLIGAESEVRIVNTSVPLEQIFAIVEKDFVQFGGLSLKVPFKWNFPDSLRDSLQNPSTFERDDSLKRFH